MKGNAWDEEASKHQSVILEMRSIKVMNGFSMIVGAVVEVVSQLSKRRVGNFFSLSFFSFLFLQQKRQFKGRVKTESNPLRTAHKKRADINAEGIISLDILVLSFSKHSIYSEKQGREKKTVPESTCEKDERIKLLVISYVEDLGCLDMS